MLKGVNELILLLLYGTILNELILLFLCLTEAGVEPAKLYADDLKPSSFDHLVIQPYIYCS